MTTLNPKAIKLPRVEKDKFVLLLRLGLDYDRDRGVFSVKSYNNIEKLMDTIRGILNSEVVFLQTCSVCGKQFACRECTYKDLCTTKDLPFSCVCAECLKEKNSPEKNLENF